MKRLFLPLALTFAFFLSSFVVNAQQTINVNPDGVNDILVIKNAIEQAKTFTGQEVIIKLGGGTYHFHRNQSIPHKYFISNTMSWNSGTNNIKNIGIQIKDAQKITIDGEGAKIITHGEISSIVVDNSQDIVLKNFTIDAADPSVTEMTVESINGNSVVYKVHETSNFEVSGTSVKWLGEYGWNFWGGGVAPQTYDPIRDITWRGSNPFSGVSSISNLGEKRIQVNYNSIPGDAVVGRTFQMRDAVRDQVAGFIHKSKDVTYDHITMNFMGNFGIVCQYSEALSFLNCRFAPDENSGRTNAGFADFLQVSGCKGLLKVEDSYFSGAHDDPINIHGTYLKVMNYLSPTQAKVKFMHHESWGFDAFFVGDSIEFINVATMQKFDAAVVTAVQRNDDQNITLTFDKAVNTNLSSGVVVENITWTPEVEIRSNYFSRVPTRGILLTTRRRSVIEDNTFFRMQMAGIYVSGDAASWYESGKVNDLTIRNNKFIECGSPVIYFDPTNSQHNGYVHNNVVIDGNEFIIRSGQALGGKSVGNVSFTNNTIIHSGSGTADSYASLNNSSAIAKSGNIKLEPGTISLANKTTFASSSLSVNDKSFAIDGQNSTSWKPETSDTDKWWAVDLGKTTSLNRIKLVFPTASAWKYSLEVSEDNVSWRKVIDQSDNSISGNAFSSSGNLGQKIRYIRVNFGSANAALTEINVFGGDDWSEKKNLISGTVIGTNGSWNNDASATKEYVFDYNINSFFDAPFGSAWVGLDLGANAAFQIDSIRYAPRSGHENRIPNGYFEISNVANFATKTILFRMPQTTPSFSYHLITNIAEHPAGRYVRYVCPTEGFGNISEIEFYGKPIGTGLFSKEADNLKAQFSMDKNASKINIQFQKNSVMTNSIFIYNTLGKLVFHQETTNKNLSIDYREFSGGVHFILLKNEKQSMTKKLIL